MADKYETKISSLTPLETGVGLLLMQSLHLKKIIDHQMADDATGNKHTLCDHYHPEKFCKTVDGLKEKLHCYKNNQ